MQENPAQSIHPEEQIPQLPHPNAAPSKMPSFAMGFIISDVVFCVIKGVIALFSFFFLFIMSNKVLVKLGCFELLTNAGICVIGLTANIKLIKRDISGIFFANMNIALTIINMSLACISLIYLASNQNGAQNILGTYLGGIIGLIVRAALLICYIVAIKQAKTFFDQQSKYQSLSGKI